MAKLYGTADTTLVSAAFKEGMSNVPKDLSDVYSKREETFKQFTEGVKSVFDNIYADDKKTWDLLTDNAQETLDILEAGGNNSEYMMDLHQGIIESYKARLKAIPDGKKGDRERSKLRAEMNKYKATMGSSEEMFMGMLNNAANSNLMSTLGDDKKKLFNAILEDYNNGTSLTKPEYVNGELVYSMQGKDGEVKLSMRDISKGMTAHDPAYLNTTQKALTDFQALGMKSKGNVTPEMLVRFNRSLSKSMTNMDQILMVSKEKFGNMAHSFEEVLTGQSKDPSLLADIFTSLEELGGIDLDFDNEIDEDDAKLLEQAKANKGVYQHAGNGVTLIDALQKDKTKYRDLLSGYLTETAAKDFYGYGVDQRKSKNNNNLSGNFFLNKQSVPKSAVTPDVNLLNKDADDIAATTSWNGVQWRKIGGKYSIVTNKGWENATRDEVAFALKFDEKVGYKPSAVGDGDPPTTTTSPPPTTKVNNNKPSIKGVPYPPKTYTNKSVTPDLVKSFDDYYKDFNVTFEAVGASGAEMKMIGPDGNSQIVEMNRYWPKNNMESQDIIQQFILNYAK